MKQKFWFFKEGKMIEVAIAVGVAGIVIFLYEIWKELCEANRLKKLELQYRNKETIPISEIHQI